LRHGGYGTVIDLIARCYERDAVKSRLRRQAAELFRELRRAGVVCVVANYVDGKSAVHVDEGLQRDFSLHHTLSLYLIEALHLLDPGAPTHALDIVSVVEAILENPQ